MGKRNFQRSRGISKAALMALMASAAAMLAAVGFYVARQRKASPPTQESAVTTLGTMQLSVRVSYKEETVLTEGHPGEANEGSSSLTASAYYQHEIKLIPFDDTHLSSVLDFVETDFDPNSRIGGSLVAEGRSYEGDPRDITIRSTSHFEGQLANRANDHGTAGVSRGDPDVSKPDIRLLNLGIGLRYNVTGVCKQTIQKVGEPTRIYDGVPSACPITMALDLTSPTIFQFDLKGRASAADLKAEAQEMDEKGWCGVVTTRLKGGGYLLKCSGTKTSKEFTASTVTRTLEVTATLIPGSTPPAEMEIAPSDEQVYSNWLPAPVGNFPGTDIASPGQLISFTAKIKPKAGSNKVPPGTIDFYLEDVGRHKGFCGNAPPDGEVKDDLRFASSQFDVIVDANDPKHAYTKNEVTEATAVVEATDTGAYGKIVARSDELGLLAVYKADGANFVRIPRDVNNNDVADAWELAEGVLDKNYPATWDEGDNPAGQMKKGDGLTLYEKYRGFVVLDGQTGHKKFARFSATQKQLAVFVAGGEPSFYDGARTFGQASGIKVWFIADEQSLKPYKDSPSPRWLNFNSTTNDGKDFGPEQFAVRIDMDDSPASGDNINSGRTVGVHGVNPEGPFVPADVDTIVIFRGHIRQILLNREEVWAHKYDPKKSPNTAALLAKYHLTNMDVAKAILKNMDILQQELIKFSVMHELGHAVGAEHHGLQKLHQDEAANGGELPKDKSEMVYYAMGDQDCPMFYWLPPAGTEFELPFEMLMWDPSQHPQNGASWSFCRTAPDADWKKIQLHR